MHAHVHVHIIHVYRYAYTHGSTINWRRHAYMHIHVVIGKIGCARCVVKQAQMDVMELIVLRKCTALCGEPEQATVVYVEPRPNRLAIIG